MLGSLRWFVIMSVVLAAVSVVTGRGEGRIQPGGDRAAGTRSTDALTKREPFRPSVHGFRFRNSFTGSPIPARYRSLVSSLGLERAVGVPATYGLCGGMSAAAADFYLADAAVPDTDRSPGEGDALYTYLSDRQLDSLGPGLVLALKFAEWMAYDDHRPGRAPRTGRTDIGVETAKQLQGIYDKLDNHDLVVLGLVYVKLGTGMLWDNHQVLAYGYDRDDAGARIRIYDPNHPGDDGVVITVRACGPGSEAVACELIPTKRRARLVRGLFEMPYAAIAPPADLRR